MKRIKKYEEISNLISTQLKKGMITNCFLSKGEFEYYIREKRLFYILYDGGLLIFIKQCGYYNLKYYINDLGYNIKLPKFSRIVIEIVGKDRKSLEKSVEFLKKNKFNVVLNRLRFSCVNPPINEKLDIKNISKLKLKDYKKTIKILRKNYDKYTGCIPTKDKIKIDIEKGNFYCYKEDNKILGILHICSKANGTEMRHLVVLKRHRGKNISKCLIEKYLLDTASGTKQVWTSTNNKVAQNLFEKFGYEPDGFVSTVLMN